MLPRSHSPQERQSTFYNSIGYDFFFFFFFFFLLRGGELMSSLDPRHHYFLIIYVMLLPGMMHAVRNRRMSLPGSVPHCEQCVCGGVSKDTLPVMLSICFAKAFMTEDVFCSRIPGRVSFYFHCMWKKKGFSSVVQSVVKNK